MEVWISKLLIKLGWCQYDACWKQSGRRGDEASPTPSVQNKSSLLPKSIVLSGLLARRWLSKASGNLPYILKLATQPFEKLREAWYNQFWTFDIDPSTTGTDSSTTCKRWPSFSGQQGWGLADWCCKYQCHVMMEVLASAFWKYIRSFLSCIYIYIYCCMCMYCECVCGHVCSLRHGHQRRCTAFTPKICRRASFRTHSGLRSFSKDGQGAIARFEI